MKSSDSIVKIAPALVKALAQIRNVAKSETAQVPTKSGGKYSYSYATLPDVLEISRSALAGCELVMMQFPRINDTGAALDLETRVLHSSGEWVGDTLTLPLPAHASPQEIGGVITYARRYHATAMLGMGQEDDDGAKASEAYRERPQPVRATKPDTKPTPEQETKAMDWIAALDECDTVDALKERFEKAVHDVHAFGFPMLDNLLIAAKDRRKAALTAAERKAA